MTRHTCATAAGAILAASCGALLAIPGVAAAQPSPGAPDPCRPGFVLSGILCTPDPGTATPGAPNAQAAPAAPAPAPAPHRSLLDRVLGRNRPAPAAPAPATPAPAPAAPAPAPAAPLAPSTASPAAPPAANSTPPPAGPPAVLPLVILPAPGTVIPSPSERTVWLHTCVDLYVANTHLLQVDNQILDVPDLATVLFQCSTNPALIGPVVPLTPVPAVPGQPPAAGNQVVFEHLPVTG